MGLFKKIAGLLGLSKDDVHESKDEGDDESDDQSRLQHRFKDVGIPRKGFSVTKQVVVDRPHLRPVLAPSTSGDGGVQVLNYPICSLILYGFRLLFANFVFFFPVHLGACDLCSTNMVSLLPSCPSGDSFWSHCATSCLVESILGLTNV